MLARNARTVLIIDVAAILSTVVSSLLGARALGPAGRGDLLVVVLWPPVIGSLATLGLVSSHRYWMAREPERGSRLFSNAVIYTVAVGLASLGLADLIVPRLVGQRSDEVMALVRLCLLNIPAALFLNLMRGLLEGTRRFGWAGLARLTFFLVQAVGFAVLWMIGELTVASAALTMICAQLASMVLALVAVWRELRPRWEPSWAEFKHSMGYGLRDYGGVIADFTTLRLDQLLLGGLASSGAIGLYVIAVRLSEVTTLAAGALAEALMPEMASARKSDRAEALLARSLRLTIYLHLAVVVPLWLAAPLILRILFGESFVAATGSFRWLLVAAAVWSSGSIIMSGLRGFGYPGMGTVARFAAAAVTVIGLLILLPRYGITGAAIASLVGYSVMTAVGLVALLRIRQIKLWRFLRPQRRDIPFQRLKSLATFRPMPSSRSEA